MVRASTDSIHKGEWIDISMSLHSGIVRWPGSTRYTLRKILSLAAGDAVNNSSMECDVHSGTHVDAPLHHFEGAGDATTLPLDSLIGPAVVADLTAVDLIDAAALAALGPMATESRLLLKTRNSKLLRNGKSDFDPSFVALTADAASWLVERSVRLVGIDYLSIQRFCDGPEVHQILLGSNVIILEGLDLFDVDPGSYDFCCLPLRLEGADGAPARAAVRRRPG